MPKTLLLADDSVTIQRVIELTFAHEDVRVVSVGDGRRAVQWLDTEWPDIVLVDVDVPEVNGYDVAAHVKRSARLQNVPVLLLAGAFEPVDQDRVRKIGCEGVLVKPFEPQQLVSRVKDLLTHAPGSASGTGQDVGKSMHEPATIAPFPVAPRAETFDAFRSIQNAVSGAFEVGGGMVPEPLEPPDRNVWEHRDAPQVSVATAPMPARAAEPPPAPVVQPRVSLVNAFSALLAAEQSSQSIAPSAPAAVLSDATVEDAVRRVLTRMTDDLVRRIVVETAERLIREEIEKIKASPE